MATQIKQQRVVPEVNTQIQVQLARGIGQVKNVTILTFANVNYKVEHLGLKSVATADTIFEYESGIVYGKYKKYTQDKVGLKVDDKEVVTELTALKLIPGTGVNNPPDYLYIKTNQFDNEVYATLEYEE